MISPTARTLKALRDAGHQADVVERWVRFGKENGATHRTPGVRRDLFGLFDILAVMGGCIVGVQCCAMSARAAHESKMLNEPRLSKWHAAGGYAQLWAWRKVKLRRGGKAIRWKCEVTMVGKQVPA